MGQRDKSALIFQPFEGIQRFKTRRDFFRQEKCQNFTARGLDLLANNDIVGVLLLEQQRTLNRVMVCEDQLSQSECLGSLIQRRQAGNRIR